MTPSLIPSGIPYIKYKWTKAYLIHPSDNIVSHPDVLLKRPFRPSYDSHGSPNLPCLLRYDYYRIWKEEHSKYQTQKCAVTKAPKKKFSPYRRKPIRGTYCGGRCGQKSPQKTRFIMKKFMEVPGKVDCRREQTPGFVPKCCHCGK